MVKSNREWREECEALQKQVKELEAEAKMPGKCSRAMLPLLEELAALKQGQGEPVGVVVEPFRPHTTHSVQWVKACPVIGTKLYTSAPISEPVARINRNAAGQIHMTDTDGNSFDMSKYIGATLYIEKEKKNAVTTG